MKKFTVCLRYPSIYASESEPFIIIVIVSELLSAFESEESELPPLLPQPVSILAAIAPISKHTVNFFILFLSLNEGEN